MDGLDAQHEPLMLDQLFKLRLNDAREPFFVKWSLTEFDQCFGRLLADHKYWVNHHADDRGLNLLLEDRCIDVLRQSGEELHYRKPDPPDLILCEVDQGWDKSLVDGPRRQYLYEWL